MGGDGVEHRVIVAVMDVQQGIVVTVTDVGHVCISQLPLLACPPSATTVLLDTNGHHCRIHNCCLFQILQRRM